MIQLLGKLPSQTLLSLVQHLDANKERLKKDVSSYAKGRERYWLQKEWDLLHREFTSGITDPFLWAECKKWMPKANLGLVVYGDIGITPHRDDSYAAFRGVGINLGEIESWYYDCQYPEYSWTAQTNPPNPIKYAMAPGDVFCFNTKNPHAAINPAKNRWAIFLWEVSKRYQKAFHKT